VIIGIDAQLSPALAEWINEQFPEYEAYSLRQLGMPDASDKQIFERAFRDGATVMTKDDDFLQLAHDKGEGPKIIWITCGNTSNQKMKQILSNTLRDATKLLEKGETVVEIADEQ
jgi:predicted nuclease of predicted toxin-antitoxin system